MSNSKKHQRWIEEVIKALVELGLEVTDDRKSKYRIIKGFIDGKPFQQRFSTTPTSYVGSARSILGETKKKLRACGVDVDKINNSLPMMHFLTKELIEEQNREKKYQRIARLIQSIEENTDY